LSDADTIAATDHMIEQAKVAIAAAKTAKK
jgi:hypothetical protein